MTKAGIMQPYFLPYMGYWQLIANVDIFVLYDTIQYTKKGWITRNRFLLNGKDEVFSVPVMAASSLLEVKDRELDPNFDRKKLIRRFEGAYAKAPYFKENFPIIEEIILSPVTNLFLYIENSVHKICSFLEINAKIIRSSALNESQSGLKGQERVIDICRGLGADQYINPIGGIELYDEASFGKEKIHLEFLRSIPLVYECFGRPCIPHMSILDVMMFNPRDEIIKGLSGYVLESGEQSERR